MDIRQYYYKTFQVKNGGHVLPEIYTILPYDADESGAWVLTSFVHNGKTLHVTYSSEDAKKHIAMESWLFSENHILQKEQEDWLRMVKELPFVTDKKGYDIIKIIRNGTYTENEKAMMIALGSEYRMYEETKMTIIDNNMVTHTMKYHGNEIWIVRDEDTGDEWIFGTMEAAKHEMDLLMGAMA